MAKLNKIVVSKEQAIQEKFVLMEQDMNMSLIEREEEIKLCLVGLLCQQHVLLIGAPGTAKSLVVETIRKWITNADSLTIHCCKDTTRNVTFGPIKLSSLKNDITERNLTGGAADTHILLLEECFKAGPAVLDMFLMMMNERIYKEGLVQKKCPLKLILGVSNEWSPEGCETALAAFFDRFLLRKEVSTIRSEGSFKRLVDLPMQRGYKRSHEPSLNSSLTLQELDLAHKETMNIPFTKETADCFLRIRQTLKAERIEPGDRRYKWSVAACQANAFLAGEQEVLPEHLEILSHILWVDPVEQPAKVEKIIKKISNPISTMVLEYRNEAEAASLKPTTKEAISALEHIESKLLHIQDNRAKKTLDYVRLLIGEQRNKQVVEITQNAMSSDKRSY